MDLSMVRDEKAYQITIASDAHDRMYDHFEFLARVSVNAAHRLLEGLLQDIRKFAYDPFRFPIYNQPYLPINKYRYIISNKRYRVVYQVCGNHVFVDDIQDCRQDDNKSLIRR